MSLVVFVLFVVLATVSLARAQPTFVKAFGPSLIGPGSISTLRFDIHNPDPVNPVMDLAFIDMLPAGVTIASPANALTDCSGAALSAPAGGSTITFSGGGLGSDTACVVTVDVTSDVVGTHTNLSGDLTSSAGNSGGAMDDLIVTTSLPGFSKSFAPNPVVPGDTSTLTFTIDNTANDVSGVVSFTDALPEGLVVATLPSASTDCGGTLSASPGSSTIALSGGFVTVPGSCSVHVDVTPETPGPKDNTTGELSYFDGSTNVLVGKAGSVLDVERGFLTKIFPDDPAPPGGTVTIAFTLTNDDRLDTATGISFTDDLDMTLTGLTAIGLPLVDPCGSGSMLTGTSVLSLTGAELGPEASCVFSATLQIPAMAAPGIYGNTTSPVAATIGGSPVMKASASDDLVVATVPVLSKSFIDDPVTAGDMVTLRFTVTNTSATEAATNISFVDILFDGLPSAAATPGADPCGMGSMATFTPATIDDPPAISLSGGNLGVGKSCTFDFVLDVDPAMATGTYVNTTGIITATLGGQTFFGLPATDSLVVVAAPSLIKIFTDDPVLPGGTVTLEFTLSLSPEAPGDATSITFTDDLDATLMSLVAVGLPANDVCGVGSQLSGASLLSFTGGSLSPGSSCTFSTTLQVPSGLILPGLHTNTTGDVTATSLELAVASQPATDDLEIGGLSFAKAFTDDPVIAGDTVTLEFTIDNLNTVTTVSNIFFTDNLAATLSGLTALTLPVEPCGAGSALTGSSFLILTGGNLGPGTSCTFSATLEVPTAAVADDYTNLTSSLFADFGLTPVTIGAASDALSVIEPLSLIKSFLDDPVLPGNTVTLEFTVTNTSADDITSIEFTDDLDAAETGLAAVGLPADDVCGVGSRISGTTFLTFTGGSLGPSSACAFAVTLLVPGGAALDTIATNTTSPITGMLGGLATMGDPASDDLDIRELICVAADGDNLTFQNGTVSGPESFKVCSTIEIGPNFQVLGPSGFLTLRAGQQIVFKNGATIGAGGRLDAGIDATLEPR